MRILANENLPRRLVLDLRAAGHDVAWIRETAPGASDERVLEQAREGMRIVATLDKGFGALAFRSGLPPTCGIILIRLPALDPQTLSARVTRALAHRFDWSGHFVAVEADRVRVRALPRTR